MSMISYLPGWVLPAVVGLAAAPPAFGVQSREPAADLVETVARFNAAIVAKDRHALERVMAPDFFWIGGRAHRGDRAGFIAALTAADLELDPYVPAEQEWIAGDGMALFVARNHLEGTSGGKPFVDPHRYSNLWRLRDGRWQLVFIQITPLPEGSED